MGGEADMRPTGRQPREELRLSMLTAGFQSVRLPARLAAPSAALGWRVIRTMTDITPAPTAPLLLLLAAAALWFSLLGSSVDNYDQAGHTGDPLYH